VGRFRYGAAGVFEDRHAEAMAEGAEERRLWRIRRRKNVSGLFAGCGRRVALDVGWWRSGTGKLPDVMTVPPEEIAQGLVVYDQRGQGFINCFNSTAGRRVTQVYSGGRTQTKRIDRKEEDKSPDKPGARSASVVDGLGFHGAVVHVGSLAEISLDGQKGLV